MKTKQKLNKEFIIMICLMFILNLLDIHSTYYFTPDLKYESNRVVQYLGLTWKNLFIVLFTSLVINSIFVFYSTQLFSYPYNRNFFFRNNISGVIFFFTGGSDSKSEIFRQCTKSILFLLGHFIFCKYIIEKLLAIFYNYIVGYFIIFSDVKGLSSEGLLDVEVDATLPIWNTFFGKFVFSYSTLSPSFKVALNNKITIIIVLLYMVVIIYRILLYYKNNSKKLEMKN